MEKRAGRTPTILQGPVGAASQAAIAEMPTLRIQPHIRAIEIFLRKGRGFTEREIGDELRIAGNTVKSHSITERMRRGQCTIGVITSMVSEGLITSAQLTEGLDFARYSQLTDPEREILDLISQEDMWDEGDKEAAYRKEITLQTVKNRLSLVFSKLGVRNKTQAIIYNLFMPEEYRIIKQEDKTERDKTEREISDRELQVLTLKARGFANKQIAGELDITTLTVRGHVTRILRSCGYRTTIDAIATLIKNGRMDASLLAGELDFDRYDSLTDREKQLLQSLVNNRDANSNKHLAYEHSVIEQVVKNGFSNILVKLAVRNRNQAAVFELLRPKAEPREEVDPDISFVISLAASADNPSSAPLSSDS